jgi:predicted acetyltransferase
MSIAVELVQAGAGLRSVLENLLQLYIHDFSELIPLDVGNDGRYSYNNLPLYWSDASRLPFLAKAGGKYAGFALIVRVSPLSSGGDVYDMAEFFVLRRYRHRGIGRELAEQVWLRYPGRWQIRVMANNDAALGFWSSSIARFTGQTAGFKSLEKDGTAWHVFSFDSLRRGFGSNAPSPGQEESPPGILQSKA